MCQLHSSVNQYIPDETHDITKSCLGKRSIQSARQSKDFNVTEYEKFTDMVSNVIL